MKLLHNFKFISGSKLNRLFLSFIASIGLLTLLALLNSGHSYALNSHDQVFSDLSQTCGANPDPARWLRSLPYQIDPSRPSQVKQGDTQVDIDVKAAAVLCNNGGTTPSSLTGIQLELYNLVPTNAGGCSTDGVSVVGGSIIGPDFSTNYGYSPQDINGQITISMRNPKATCVEVAFDASVCVVNTLPSQWAYYRCSNDPNVRGTSTHHTIRIPVAYPTGNVSVASDCSAVSGNWPAYAGTGTTIFMRIEQNGSPVADNINAQIDGSGNFAQQTFGQMVGRSGTFIAYARVGNGDEIAGPAQSLNCPGGGGGGGTTPTLSATCNSGTISGSGNGFTANNSANYSGPGYQMNINIDGSGSFSLPPDSGLNGTYTLSAIDNATGMSAPPVQVTCSSGSITGIPSSNYFFNCINTTWLQFVVHAPEYTNAFGVQAGEFAHISITVDGVTVLDHNKNVVSGSNVPGPAPVIPGPAGNSTPMYADSNTRIVDDNTMRNTYNGARWTYGFNGGATQLAAEYFMNSQQASQAHTIVVRSSTIYKSIPAGGGIVSYSESATTQNTFSAPACQQQQTPAPQYFIDQADCNAVAGWAADANDPNKTLYIRIRLVGNSNGRIVSPAVFPANTPSADVGPHRFSWPMESGVKTDSQAYSLTVTILDSNQSTALGTWNGTVGPCASASQQPTCSASNGLPPRVYGVASAYPNTNNPPQLKIRVTGGTVPDFESTIATDPAGGWWYPIDGSFGGPNWMDWDNHTMNLIVISSGQVLSSTSWNCPGSFTITPSASLTYTEDSSGNAIATATNTASLSGKMPPSYTPGVSNSMYVLYTNGSRSIIASSANASGSLTNNNTSVTYTISGASAGSVASLLGQQICTDITIDHTSYGGPAGTATSCQRVSIKPYVQAYGADIWSGGVFGTYDSVTKTNSCGSSTNSGYIRMNTNSGSVGGGGTQLAALATELITGMQSRVNSAGGHNDRLIFANSSATKGRYTSSLRCMFDYYGALDKTNSNASQIFVNGNVTLSSATLGTYFNASQSRTLIASGTVTISTNIITSSSFSVGTAPVFVIVARNINIDPSVSRINATLIAQTDPANAANTGIIQTCATAASNYFSSCGANAYKSNPNNLNDPSRLVIHGSLVARKIYFQRTWGHVNIAPDSDARDAAGELNNSRSAEMIDFSPEAYLGRAVLIGLPTTSAQPTGTKYDSFEQLPPIF